MLRGGEGKSGRAAPGREPYKKGPGEVIAGAPDLRRRPKARAEGPGSVDRGLRHDGRLRPDADLAVLDVGDEARSVLPHRGDGELDLLVDVALQEARAVGRAVALLRQQVERGLSHAAALALLLHLAAELAGVYLRDVA